MNFNTTLENSIACEQKFRYNKKKIIENEALRSTERKKK